MGIYVQKLQWNVRISLSIHLHSPGRPPSQTAQECRRHQLPLLRRTKEKERREQTAAQPASCSKPAEPRRQTPSLHSLQETLQQTASNCSKSEMKPSITHKPFTNCAPTEPQSRKTSANLCIHVSSPICGNVCVQLPASCNRQALWHFILIPVHIGINIILEQISGINALIPTNVARSLRHWPQKAQNLEKSK